MAVFTPQKPPKPIEIDKFLGINEAVGNTETKPGEAIYSRNFRITSNNKLEKRGGHTTFIDETQPTKAIQGMWYGRILTNMVMIYACNGNIKQKIMPAGATTTIGIMTDAKTEMFYFGSRLYLMNGTEYKYYDGTNFADVSTIAKVPVVAIGSPPTGGGTLFEEINLLTGKKSQEFTGTGSATLYQLAETAITSVDSVKVNGVLQTVTTHYTVNLTNGTVTFVTAPINNALVEIAWTKVDSTHAGLVTRNRAATIFGPGNDTTVFIWGDPQNIHRRTFSGTLDPTYWPVNNFTLVGSNEYAITDMQPQYDRLIIFKEEQTFYSTPEFISTLNKYDYPVYPLNYSIGNVAFDGVQVVRNNPVSLYGGTVWEWVSTQVKDERNATDRGERLSESLGSADLSTAITFDNQPSQELWINIGSLVHIWNYDNDTMYTYDNITANCFLDIAGVVYYGTKDGKIERFAGVTDDNGIAVNAIWKTGFMDFGLYEYKKNSRDMWFMIQPANRTSVDIMLPTNLKNEQDPSLYTFKTFTKGYALFDFADVNFGNMTFQTNRNPQTFRFKVKAKKYTSIQVVIGNSKVDETLVFLGFKLLTEIGSFSK